MNYVNKLKIKSDLTENLSIVLWSSNLSSTAGIRYTKHELSIVKIPYEIKSIFIGIILSDGHLALQSKSKNAYLIFNQSLAKLAYVYFVYNYICHYCQSYPKLSIGYRLNNPSYILRVTTRSMPCITELYENFYLNKKKIIKSSIYFDLTPIALAHWIMGDGYYNNRDTSTLLCTDSFSIQDIVILMNVLLIRYNISSTIQYSGKKYPRIHIRKKSMPKLQKIVLPYMHESMLYKLGI